MPIIVQVQLNNYKSFRNLDFRLRSLNILIGRNGAGKSNFISFFRMLRDASEGHLADNIRLAGGLNELRWRGSRPSDYVDWEITFQDLEHVTNRLIYYSGSLAAKGNSFSIRQEEIARDPYPGYEDRYKYLGAYDGYPRILSAKPDAEENEIEDVKVSNGNRSGYTDQELIIAQLRDPLRYPLLDEIRRLMTDWSIFRGLGENALDNLYKAQPLDVTEPLRLDPQGRNLVSILHALDNDTRYADADENLKEILSAAFEDFSKLDIRTLALGMVGLYWRTKKNWAFPAAQMSDGVLRFLGLATLLLLPDPPSLIAIDEPEIGLHPQMIPLLGGLLKRAAARTQIIVSTHSPLLLNEVEAEDVVTVEVENGITSLTRQDSDRLQIWLDRYTLGNLWTMGKLER